MLFSPVSRVLPCAALERITQKAETITGDQMTWDYGYDAAGRLVSSTLTTPGGSWTTTYTHDANGNRLSKTGQFGAENGTYDAQDRMTAYGPCTHAYTANGELTTKTCGSEVTTYQYDTFGNLTHVTMPDGIQIDYVIDARNRRIGKKVNGVLVQGFLYGDQLNPIAELDGSGNLVARYVYGTKPNVPDYMVKGAVTYRYVTDQLGSVRLVVDAATGTVAQRIDYDEYGVVIGDTNPGFQPFGFAGGITDTHTELVRFGARDYDHQAGRWTSKDPAGSAGGDPNLFSYGMNDPVIFSDSSGLKTCIVFVVNPVFTWGFPVDGVTGIGLVDHVGLWIGRGGEEFLYDPAGGYMPGGWRNSDFFSGPEANFGKYREWHEANGEFVEVYCFDTTECEEQSIMSKALAQPDQVSGGFCAGAVSGAIHGVGPFAEAGSLFPGWLRRQIRRINRSLR